jgi:DNA-binding CsgD family transcriptional regulator
VTESVARAADAPEQWERVFTNSPVPFVLIDGRRRYVDANGAGCLALRIRLDDLRALSIYDVATPAGWPELDLHWNTLYDTGESDVARFEIIGPSGGSLDVAWHAAAEAVGDYHLVGFAPSGWREQDLPVPPGASPAACGLSPRQVELLQLAADGLSGPEIAEQLVLSPATVRTHFQYMYRKLGVTDRAAAVAEAMRMGVVN